MRRIGIASAALFAALTLSACNDGASTQDAALPATPPGATAAQAASMSDWDLYLDRELKINYGVAKCAGWTLDASADNCSQPMGTWVTEALVHLTKAAKSGDERALRTIVARDTEIQIPTRYSGIQTVIDPQSILPAIAPDILADADASMGQHTSLAALYLRLAGDIVRDGLGVTRNYDRATLYFGAAWLAGDHAAAGLAANVYGQTHDEPNQYLWTLRCDDTCSSTIRLQAQISELESNLDGPTMKLVQNRAGDKTVLGL